MDRELERRSTVSVQSSTPSSLRHCVYPTPSTAKRVSLRHSPTKTRPKSLQSAAVTRVKGDFAMDSRTSTDMSCTEDLPSMTASPKSAYSHTPRSRTPETTTTLVNPSSSLLQDLLKEQRASRGSRGTISEECDDNTPRTPDRSGSDSQSQSQSRGDPGSERQRKITNALSSGLKQPREMGMRETDQYISRLNKQNFDLKLEIFHRAQQIIAMEKKLERMAEMEEDLRRMRQLEDELQELREAEDDNLRLRESNEQLRQEIDKRDQAVTEAVELICQLEARLEEAEGGQEASRPSTARDPSYDYEDATPRNKATFGIPERRSSKRSSASGEYRRVSSGSRNLKRPPSFLTDRKESTAALRSLYAPVDDQCAMSVITKSDSLISMSENPDIESPRLSALSECSELNPYTDGTGGAGGFDQITIPVREREPPSERSDLSLSQRSGIDDRKIADWIQPQPDPFTDTGRNAKPPPLDVSQESNKLSVDSNSFWMGSSQRTPLDSVFGSTRLPPTPDTMSTACAGGGNGSNGSAVADNGQNHQAQSVKRRLARPRSAGELTTKQSSTHSNVANGLDTNTSKVTLPRRSLDEKEEIPAIFPLDSITSRTGALLSQESIIKPSFGHYGGNEIFNPRGLERVFSKMERNHFSPAMFEARQRGPAASPPLTPQDWVEAAKSGSRAREEQTGVPPTGPLPAGSRLVGARAPSQSSFLGRRHSIDSAVRDTDLPIVPTLDLSSLERDPQPEPDSERSRRRISLRPFFNRSGSSRRLQESPTIDFLDKDDCAPAPVVRKTRQIANSRAIQANQNIGNPSTAGYGNPGASAPTYADTVGEDVVHKTLPHSLTERNFTTGTMTKNSLSHVKDHKRRSSLGILGWVKGASGLASLGKRTESVDSTAASSQPSGGVNKSRVSSRLGQDAPGPATTIPEANQDPNNLAAMNIVVEDFAYNPKRTSRAEEEEPGRRPRYMERRSRRA